MVNANGRHARYWLYDFRNLGTVACGVVVAVNEHQINFFLALRWKVTKLNNGVRDNKMTPPECSIFWENVSVFSLYVIINPSFSRRHYIGMVLAFLTPSNSLLKLHIFGNYLQLKWSLHQNVCLDKSYWFLQVWSCKYAHETFGRQKAWIWTYFKFVHFFAFEAKLLEIEPEDNIHCLHYVQVFSVQKRFVKGKI